MGPKKKKILERLSALFKKVANDNLFLLSSSISYYSALALAPFLLILLWVASLLGQRVQDQIITHAHSNFSPQVSNVLELVFTNVEQGEITVGSIPGVVGLGVLFFTCSIVFLQFRFAFDVIYGYHDPALERSIWAIIKERLFAMFAVLSGILLLLSSFAAAAIIEYMLAKGIQENEIYRLGAIGVSFLVYVVLFTALHRYTPTRRQPLGRSFQMGALTAVFFILGNFVLAFYLQNFARTSVYGAAGTLLVFLIWVYYSAFIIFLSVELFQHVRPWNFLSRQERIKKRPRILGLRRYFLK